MNLESPKVSVKKSSNEIFEFLIKVENFGIIMPENTDKFEVRENGFLFALKGMPEIRVKMHDHIASEKVVLTSANDKFPFTLTGNMQEIADGSSEVHFVFDGKFNMMMTMMIKAPLQKFINSLAENMENLK